MFPIVTTEDSAKQLLISRASFHRLANDGQLPVPFKITPNRSVLFQYEIDEIVQARAAGANDGEIKVLVTNLLERRHSVAENVKPTEKINNTKNITVKARTE